MISQKSRFNAISETDQNVLAEAIANVVLSVAVSPRPVYPENPTDENIKSWEKSIIIDTHIREQCRDFARNIPDGLGKYIYVLLASNNILARKPDHPDAPVEHTTENKEWLLYDSGGNPTTTSPRITLSDMTTFLGVLFNYISVPAATIV